MVDRIFRGASVVAARCATAVLVGALLASTARAEPPVTAPDGSRVLSFAEGRAGIDMSVHSALMGKPVALKVLRAPDDSKPAPTLYLLNGADGGIDRNWADATDVAEFFADKQVNIVIPFGGEGSYFTDWRADDPALGKQRWATFLTRELPPIVDAMLNTTGANAIAGISMAGTAVFQLALSAPGVYRAIGSYSGCVRTSDARGQAVVNAVVASQQGNPVNMWGPPSDPAWAANDPYLHAEKLRGTAIYVASGNGSPGPYDTVDGVRGDLLQLTYQLIFGAPLEAIAAVCTRQLRDRLRELRIPATVDLRATGTHSWGYWQQDLHNSWPTFSAALNR
ncbi:alpha/beta hydrolase [Nocardia brasiliensis]|uniref:alpha/beta hydrolase n=1 Tax=Nocardia brasiliensis TaxID=37326 RepID=UPI002456728F|nr:alpha/beta hydrolase family protein [Nocardia brasiliensis]